MFFCSECDVLIWYTLNKNGGKIIARFAIFPEVIAVWLSEPAPDPKNKKKR